MFRFCNLRFINCSVIANLIRTRGKPSSMTQSQLLVIDDDRWLLESMSDWLRSEGYLVHTADSISTAKKKVGELTAIDLILCDVRLQDADGMDFLKWCIAKHPRYLY